MKFILKIQLIAAILTLSFVSVSAITQGEKLKLMSNIDLAKNLREAIISDKELSPKAHNIKIMTNNDSITLVGEVASRAEKVRIENLARARAGHKKVYNRLDY